MASHGGTVYGIMEGRCKVVCKIHIIRETPPYGQHKLRMITRNKRQSGTVQTTRHQTEEDKFLVIRTLERGDFFGFGERLQNTSVISEKKVSSAIAALYIYNGFFFREVKN